MISRGPWSQDRIDAFLAETRVPVRIACNGSSGHPVIASLWFVPLEGRLWCATQRSAAVASHLARDGRCAFEVANEASPYRGVRGRASASLHDDRGEEILRLLIERYLGTTNTRLAHWLLERATRETAIAVQPLSMLSWDYSERMEGSAR